MATATYKCPNCDSGLTFDPASQEFNCDYCHSHFTLQEMEHIHQSTAQSHVAQEGQQPTPPPKQAQWAPPPEAEGQPGAGAAAAGPTAQAQGQAQAGQAAEPGQIMLYSCPSCGAEIATDATTAATYCYYCHNPVVLLGQLEGQYRPNKLIPFSVDRPSAVNAFLKWAKSRWFVPKGFFSEKQVEKITGVYFPYWLVDSDLKAETRGTATRVRVWQVGETEYTETQYFSIARGGNIHFEDISKNALRKENSKLCDGVHPYRSEGIIEYTPAYLSGFQAERRNVEAAEYQNEVSRDIENFSQRLLRDTVQGYATVNLPAPTITGCHLNWDYTLLPVWTLTYKGQDGKTYFYTMNGQTGKVTGILPLNRGKLLLTFGLIALGVGVALALIFGLGGIML